MILPNTTYSDSDKYKSRAMDNISTEKYIYKCVSKSISSNKLNDVTSSFMKKLINNELSIGDKTIYYIDIVNYASNMTYKNISADDLQVTPFSVVMYYLVHPNGPGRASQYNISSWFGMNNTQVGEYIKTRVRSYFEYRYTKYINGD